MNQSYLFLVIFIVVVALITGVIAKMSKRRRAPKDEYLEIKTPTRFVQRPPQVLRKASQSTAKTVTKDDPAARRR